MGILGSTLSEIAAVKAGIIKKGSIAVTTAQEPEVMEVLRFRAQREGVPLMEAAPLEAGQVKSSLSSQTFSIRSFRKYRFHFLEDTRLRMRYWHWKPYGPCGCRHFRGIP